MEVLMNSNFPVSASIIRTKYAQVFKCVVQLYRLREPGERSTKFEDVVKLTEEMHQEGLLSDYLYENLNEAYNLYQTLLPGKVAAGYKKNHLEEENKLSKIEQLLDMLIKDLNEEIADVAERIAERMASELPDEDK